MCASHHTHIHTILMCICICVESMNPKHMYIKVSAIFKFMIFFIKTFLSTLFAIKLMHQMYRTFIQMSSLCCSYVRVHSMKAQLTN